MNKYLIVLLGATGVGKTNLSINIARHFDTEIISSDSRQVYREMQIGTAVPNRNQLSQITHHFIGTHSVEDYFSAFEFENQTLRLLEELFKNNSRVLMVGGSMMYIDAVCKGIDEIPTIDEQLRKDLQERYEKEGIASIRMELKYLDPVFYNEVDLKNDKRIIHAVEVCLMSGKPYSLLRTNTVKERDFKIIKIGLDRERKELYNNIDLRVDSMIEKGLVEEAQSLFNFRHLNSLNTVGYKELFEYFKGAISLERAVELIKRNSRRYAKRQLSWFRRDKNIKWFNPDNEKEILTFIKESI